MRTPELPKSGFFTILRLRKPSWTTRGGLQVLMAKTAKASTIHPAIISLCVPKATHSPKLRFRALLGEGIPEVEMTLP